MRALTQHNVLEKVEELLHSGLDNQSISTADYLLLLLALREIEPQLAPKLHDRVFGVDAIATATNQYQLVAGLSLQMASALQHKAGETKQQLQSAFDLQEAIRLQIDPHYTGLIRAPFLEGASDNASLAAQCYWTRNLEALLELAPKAEEAGELILQLDIVVHETNEQLWDAANGGYYRSDSVPHIPEYYLPLWARIPSLDQAEDLLKQLRTHASPWQSASSADDWLCAESYLVFEGLKHYEMLKAANELRSHVLQRIQTTKDSWQRACLSICFAASSPA